tara:strand:- start:108 stop:623 length:516 start_codon:yes stop_codon:yes gene_type:complete
MKKIFIGLLSIFLSLSSLSMSMACEIFKEPIGTSLSSIIDKYDNLDEPPENNAEIYTYHKMYPSWLFCENPYLKETYVEIYIREGKIIATKISGMPGEAKENKILDFAKTYLGYTTDQSFNDKWTGAIEMSSITTKVIYGRENNIKGILEVLIISNSKFFDLMVTELYEYF